MIHPDLHRVSHLASVKAAVRGYRAAYVSAANAGGQHADDWSAVKAAETALNDTVENILAGE